jgi:hypothetical protein
MVPAARELLVEWEKEAPLTVAALRAEAGRDLSAPDYQALISDLLEGSPDFAAIWARQDVRGRREGLKRFQHPELGRLIWSSRASRSPSSPRCASLSTRLPTTAAARRSCERSSPCDRLHRQGPDAGTSRRLSDHGERRCA